MLIPALIMFVPGVLTLAFGSLSFSSIVLGAWLLSGSLCAIFDTSGHSARGNALFTGWMLFSIVGISILGVTGGLHAIACTPRCLLPMP